MHLQRISANNTQGVIYLYYNNLQDLIYNSSSSRKYFLSLPVSMQLSLHEHNDYIHTSAGLHTLADIIEKYNHSVENSKTFYFSVKN